MKKKTDQWLITKAPPAAFSENRKTDQNKGTTRSGAQYANQVITWYTNCSAVDETRLMLECF